MGAGQVIEPELVWLDDDEGGRFERGVQVEVGADGRIARVGRLGLGGAKHMRGRALLPGFVSAHSHAFQRGLRGRTEEFPPADSGGAPGTFWSWRAQMYGLVERLTPELAHELSLRCFREMLAAGITSVGEFHYIHHGGDGDDFALDGAVIDAARDAGIRLALLYTFYNTGGIDQPLSGAQRRFRVQSTGQFWDRVDAARERMDPATMTVGAAAHSVRAAGLDDIAALHEEACRRGMVLHMHVEEQRKEIMEAVDALGCSPMAALLERLEIDERFTAVHCTHTDPSDMEAFLQAGGNVCLCPITEANLGDGVPDLPGMLDDIAATEGEGAGALCIGTDSNSRLSMTEELRWLEYTHRLQREQRGVVLDERGSNAAELLRMGGANGARSLGLDAGRIEPGMLADFCAVDLSHPSLAGWDVETLAEALVFGAADGAVAGACVGGRWVS